VLVAQGKLPLFQRHDHVPGQTAATAALSMSQSVGFGQRLAGHDGDRREGWRDRLAALDLVPDLGTNIGTGEWWRGVATVVVLCAAILSTAPGFEPIDAAAAAPMAGRDFDEMRAQSIMPLAFGGDSGRHMAATDAVRPLAQTPERPQLELTAVYGQGDSFARVLERAGVGGAEAARLASQVAAAVPLSDISAGTRIDLVLGRRPARNVPRPLDALAMRARFDLRIEMERIDGNLVMRRIPIAVDNTPLRIRARVGDSLYRSARAAGASAGTVQSYLRVMAGQLSVARDIRASDEFDIIVEHRRAETGESESGKMLYAALVRDGRPKVQMVEWTVGGRAQWFEASGVGEQRGGLARPTAGPVTSTYGMRRHPILGYRRMHSGMDFGGGYGAPIYAVTDGLVMIAGRHGGYGNYVRIAHGGGLGSGYGHMSRIAVAPGQRVVRGQVIGYIGSTGLSTGPHLHYELYRNGAAVNPASVTFVTRALLAGQDLANFRAKLQRLLTVKPGAALSGGPAVVFEPPKAGSLARTAAERAGGSL
jgi:murein DD-endopeptidase MepM/ murein hydrolase activator NlpD